MSFFTTGLHIFFPVLWWVGLNDWVGAWLQARDNAIHKITTEVLILGFQGLTVLLCDSFCQCKVNTDIWQIWDFERWKLQRLHYNRQYSKNQFIARSIM